MEIKDAQLGFTCPKCLRKQGIPFTPETLEVAIAIEPCPVHVSHAVVEFRFTCPNCGEPGMVELVDSEIPGVEDE